VQILYEVSRPKERTACSIEQEEQRLWVSKSLLRFRPQCAHGEAHRTWSQQTVRKRGWRLFLYFKSVDAICADHCACKIFVPMHLINNHVRFQLDCGATINILPVNTYKQIANNPAHRSFSRDVIIVCLETRAFWISGLCRCMTQDYDQVCWKKYTYLTMLSPFRSLSIRKSAYVNTYFFSTDNQSPR